MMRDYVLGFSGVIFGVICHRAGVKPLTFIVMLGCVAVMLAAASWSGD